MKYIKYFDTEHERQSCLDTYKYMSYTEEDKVVNIHQEVPPFFCKLTLNNGEVVEIEGSGELTDDYIIEYQDTLVTLELGDLCTSIGDATCIDYLLLENLIIGNNVTTIGNYTFQHCIKLTNILLGNNVTIIGEGAFEQCELLTSIHIPDSVTYISPSAFSDCASLTNVTFGNNITTIGEWSFRKCTNLTSITIPASIISIENAVFFGCASLISISVDSNNTVYDSRNNCNAIIKTAANELKFGCSTTIIPNSVTSVGNRAF